MGHNIALNLINQGFEVQAYDTNSEIRECVKIKTKINIVDSLDELIETNSKSTKLILLMIPAGSIVDNVLNELLIKLSYADIIIDAGNSKYLDSKIRYEKAKRANITFIDMGVSGGHYGARHGASIMAGGDQNTVEEILPIFSSISAINKYGDRCFVNTGPSSSAHFVKMIHNGIEYAMMQLIGESYSLLRIACGYTALQAGKIFRDWDEGILSSYLMQISHNILMKKDEADGTSFIDKVSAISGQNGTGSWSVEAALKYMTPVPLISSAVETRNIYKKNNRHNLHYAKNNLELDNNIDVFVDCLHNALYIGLFSAYIQGFELLSEASKIEKWNLNMHSIARGWGGGCIIRSILLDDIGESIKSNKISKIVTSNPFNDRLYSFRDGLDEVIKQSIALRISIPSFSTIPSWLDKMNCGGHSVRIIQGQRDYFGNHGFYMTHDN